MRDIGDRQVALCVHVIHTTEAGATDGRTVISVGARDNDLFLWLTEAGPVMAYHADHRVITFGTGVGIENMVKTGRSDFGDEL